MMRSAADFLPLFMTTFMNFASISLLNFGSGRMVRTGAWALRDITQSYSLCAARNLFCRSQRPAKSGGHRPVNNRGAWRRPENLLILLLPSLGAVLGATLLALADAGAVQSAADRVVADARQVLHASAADEHHRVLLKVVAFTTDVARDFVAVREAYAADLPEGRIRLLRRRRVDARTDTTLLGRCPKRRYLRFFCLGPARLPDELTRGRHTSITPDPASNAFALVRDRVFVRAGQ